MSPFCKPHLVSHHSSVWGSVYSQCTVFFQQCGGRHRVSEALQMAGEWADTGSEMHHVCNSEDHQLLRSSNRAKEVSEPHTQMVSKSCVNSMSVTENLRSAHCVYKAIITYFVREQTSSRYCLWTFWCKQKAHVWTHGHDTRNTRELGRTLLHADTKPVWGFGIE